MRNKAQVAAVQNGRTDAFALAFPCLGLVLLLAFALPARSCHAQFTARDGQIIARTLSFIEPSINGSLEIGIVYAPDRPASVRQAESLRSAIGDALIAGKVTLKSHLVPVDQLGSATGLAGIFVTGDLGTASG